jgi:hypothetical protein
MILMPPFLSLDANRPLEEAASALVIFSASHCHRRCRPQRDQVHDSEGIATECGNCTVEPGVCQSSES